MKITKIDQLKGSRDQSAVFLINRLLRVQKDVIEILGICDNLYNAGGGLSQYEKDFEDTILDIANVSLHFSNEDGKLHSNNPSSSPESRLEKEILIIAKDLENFISSGQDESDEASLKYAEGTLSKNLANLKKSKAPDPKISTECAAILFAGSLFRITKAKFSPKPEYKGPIVQALRYMSYVLLAASSAVLLARGASALKEKLQDKKNNDKGRQDPPALQ